MSANIQQIFTNNPSTTLPDTALVYLGLSPFGLTNDSAITGANLKSSIGAAYLPLAGGTMSGTIQTTENIQWNPSTYSTGTLTQSGTLVTFTNPPSSSFSGAYVVPASGSPFYLLQYNGGTWNVDLSQTIAAGTAFNLYYFDGTTDDCALVQQQPAFQNLFPSRQKITIGDTSGAFLSLWNHFGSQAFGNGLAVGNGSTALITSGNPVASQSGTTVTATSSVFSTSSVGRLIRFSQGYTAFIRAYISGTQVTVDVSQTVPLQQFFVVGTGSSEGVSIGSRGDLGCANLYVAGTKISAGTTNLVYVDGDAGNDTTGTGTAINPYATITKALSVITTATASNIFTILAYGGFSEAAIALKPFVNLSGWGNQATVISVTGGGNNVTLDSSWTSTASPKMVISNVKFNSTNISFSRTSGSGALRIDLDNVDVTGTTTLTGQSGSDFYYVESCELVGNVTIQDCLYQSYSNVYDSTVLYRNSIAPSSSFMQAAGDLYNGTLDVTAGTAQSITAFVNNSTVSGGSTVTGATANITYDIASYQTAPTSASSGTSTQLATSGLNIAGGEVHKVRTVTGATTTALATDYVLACNRAGTIGVTLIASPSTGRTYRIKDISGAAATNNITITPASGNIDGAASYTINTNYGSVDLVYTGSQWSIL